MHQSCSVKGNDLNHLVEGNQVGLLSSIVFERITPPHTNIFYIPNIKALALVISDKKVFSCFPSMGLCETCDPQAGHLCPMVKIFNIFGRGQLGDVT